jgi:hypothetical protein
MFNTGALQCNPFEAHMKKMLFFAVLAFFLVGCTAKKSGPDSITLTNGQLARYYDNYNYVVKNSTVEERQSIIATLQNHAAALIPKSDTHQSLLYEKLRAVLDAELSTDPGMVVGPNLRMDFLYNVIPLEMIPVTEDHILVKTRRSPFKPIDAARLVAAPASGASGGFIEIHTWVLQNGAWRISDMRMDLIAGG